MFKDLFYEFFGTAMMILLGTGVCSNVSLAKTKGNSSGWIVIAFGWAFAVFVGAYIALPSGAHLNPSVTIGLAVAGVFKGNIIGYIIAQMLGGFVGAVLMYFFYKPHFDKETNPDVKLGVFATAPAVKSTGYNLFSEIVATYVLLVGILLAAQSQIAGPLPVGLLIASIGMSLGGTTGYAMNAARDLSPRVAHFILPIKGKRDSDWAYSWIPVVGPAIGAALGGLTILFINTL